MRIDQGDRRTLDLNAGEVLTIVADPVSSGRVVRLGARPGDVSAGATPIAAGETATFGPFVAVTRYEVVPATGFLTVTTATNDIATYTDERIAAGALALLASTTVDLDDEAATKQPLYPVPAGKRAVVLFVSVRDHSGEVTTADGSAGFNAGATDWANASFTFADAVVLPGNLIVGDAGDVFGVIISTPEGAPLTCVVDVFGYLLDA